MYSRPVLVLVAVVGAISLFAIGSRIYSDTNTVDPHGPTRTEMIQNLEHQMGHLREAGVPSECVDLITAGGLTCIETCLPHQYMLGTEAYRELEVSPPTATTPILCELVFCHCSDGREVDLK